MHAETTGSSGRTAGLSPRVVPGEFVFVTVDPDRVPRSDQVVASIIEAEGPSVVLARAVADSLGYEYGYVAGWISLGVSSDLAAVGLTAVVASALSAAGISANVIAGHHHDHVFVPSDRVDEAVSVIASTTWPYPG